jgi:hypothetical protein
LKQEVQNGCEGEVQGEEQGKSEDGGAVGRLGGQGLV